MNPRLAILIDPKAFRPDFIKKKDIRGITPDFLLGRFKDRAIAKNTSGTAGDILTISVARGKGKLPDEYVFIDEKFVHRIANRDTEKMQKRIITEVTKDGYTTKTYTREASAEQSKNMALSETATKFGKVKSRSAGFWGFFGFKPEVFSYRYQIKTSTPDMNSESVHLDSFAGKLFNKEKRIIFSDDSKNFSSLLFTHSDNVEQLQKIQTRRDTVIENPDNLPKSILKVIKRLFNF